MLLKSNPPIACFFANSKSEVIPEIPNFLYEKYRLRKVGIEPNKIPFKKRIFKLFFVLYKLKARKGDKPIIGTKTI